MPEEWTQITPEQDTQSRWGREGGSRDWGREAFREEVILKLRPKSSRGQMQPGREVAVLGTDVRTLMQRSKRWVEKSPTIPPPLVEQGSRQRAPSFAQDPFAHISQCFFSSFEFG